MANEFKHKDPGSALTQAEFIASDGTGHIFDGQAAGDVLYASSATVLKNLAKATDGNILELASGLPAWTASPTIGSTSWANANHAHAASNSGGTVSANAVSGTTLKSCVVTSSLTAVAVLGSGSIATGFGNIDNGSSTITTTGAITGGSLVADNFTLDGTELDLSSGDFTLDVAGDVEINADGGCINFKDGSLALAAIINTSCVGELRIHEAANYIGLKPPALSANQTWTWPATKGSCGEVLTCDGCGVLSWEAGGASTGLVRIGTQVVAAACTCTACLTVTGLSSTYDSYLILISDFTPISEGQDVLFRVGDSSGVDSGGTDYHFHMQKVNGGSACYAACASAGASAIQIGNCVGSTGAEGFGAALWLHRPGDATTVPVITGTSVSKCDGGNMMGGVITGFRTVAITLDRVNVSFISGNIQNGRMTVYGALHA